MKIISRKAAKAAGHKYYFTGKPCKRGHIDQRFVQGFHCVTCGRDKARETYRGLSGEQKQRVLEANRARSQQWNAAHREEQRPKFAAYRQKAKAQKPDYFKQHYAKHKDRRKREANEWYHANADRAAGVRRVYVDANRDKVRVWARKSAGKRRSIKKQVFVEVVDPRVVFDRDKGVCGICLAAVDPSSTWEIDHIVPISKGGVHSYANVQLAHRRCNRSKAARVA